MNNGSRHPDDCYLPSSNSQYKKVEYWDERYSVEPHYEWLASYNQLGHLLKETLDKFSVEARILQLGCGNSDLAMDLYKSGFRDVTNIDISAVCVANMKAKYPHLNFVEMDMTQLNFPSSSFDLVIEKASLDALLVDSVSPWDLESPGHQLVSQSLREVKRVLSPDGVFLSVTFSQPHHRVPLLAQPGLNWEVQVDKVSCEGSMLDYFVMRMEEGGEGCSEDAMRRFSISKGPVIDYSRDFTSEDEETFINNVRVCSDDETSEEEVDLST